MDDVRSFPPVFAICGIKNSGKTTLVSAVVKILTAKGYNIAVIKHDGHDFTPDVPGTDSFCHREAGAFGVGVISSRRYMLTKETPITIEEMTKKFPEADLILLEGFKGTSYPKIEILRRGVSSQPSANLNGLIGVAADQSIDTTLEILPLNQPEKVADFIEKTTCLNKSGNR